MAEFPTTDEEQVEIIKKWWSENGLYLLAGVLLGLAGLFGWNYWQSYTSNRAMQGSDTYVALQRAVESKDLAKTAELKQTLTERYAATPYDEFGLLAEAALHVRLGDLGQAEASLQQAIDTASVPELKDVARLRLATVLNSAEKYQQALALLDEEFPDAYVSLVEEYRGDALLGTGDTKAAAAAYDRALLTSNGQAEYLQWKRNDLGDGAS